MFPLQANPPTHGHHVAHRHKELHTVKSPGHASLIQRQPSQRLVTLLLLILHVALIVYERRCGGSLIVNLISLK